MSRRRENKRLAREARNQRIELVHAAGCNHQDCASKWFKHTPEWAKDPTLMCERRVSVPRSIRPHLGPYIGGVP